MFCCSVSGIAANREVFANSFKRKEEPGCFSKTVLSCCCLKLRNNAEVDEWMVVHNAETQPPSLFRRLLLCQWSATERKPSGLELIPQLRGLGGVLLQDGTHTTAGTLLTLKYGDYDPEKRELTVSVYGGFQQASTTGNWTEDVNLIWCCLMNLARSANYSYIMTFTPDYKQATIDISGNLCCCIPCLPRWTTVPRSIVAFSMVQDMPPGPLAKVNGTIWSRRTSIFGGEPQDYYKLVTVVNSDGSKGPYFDRLAEVAPQYSMTTY
jgi:hypothetical protein